MSKRESVTDAEHAAEEATQHVRDQLTQKEAVERLGERAARKTEAENKRRAQRVLDDQGIVRVLDSRQNTERSRYGD